MLATIIQEWNVYFAGRLLTDKVWRCRILEQLASSPQPRYWVSGHDDDGQCATRYARPGKPEGKAVEMETRMAEEFPPLPSQLFGSPAQDTLPYLSAVKASQQGMSPSLHTLVCCTDTLTEQCFIVRGALRLCDLMSGVVTGTPVICAASKR